MAFAFTYQGDTRPKGWTISGGGQRPHESVRAATEREITEETGLDPATDLILLNRTPIDIPGRAGKINKFSIYVLRVDRDEYARRNVDAIFANRTGRDRERHSHPHYAPFLPEYRPRPLPGRTAAEPPDTTHMPGVSAAVEVLRGHRRLAGDHIVSLRNDRRVEHDT